VQSTAIEQEQKCSAQWSDKVGEPNNESVIEQQSERTMEDEDA